MILKSLHVKNFRKFKDAYIEFPDGITSIIGLNGVGKSTIIESIAWVLYGSVAARTPADQIKREYALPSEPCRVELEFIFEEDTYRITREMTGKTLAISAVALMNGKIIAEGAEIVTKFIQKKLGMDFKSFYTSIFAKQKELNALSSMNPSERRPLILRMLGINEVDGIISKLRSDTKTKTDLIEQLRQNLFNEDGTKRTDEYHKEILSLQKKKQETEKTSKQINSSIQNIEKERIHQEKVVQLLKSEYERSVKSKSELDDKKLLFDRKKTIEIEIQNLEKKLDERKKYIEKQKTELQNFKDLKKDIEKLQKALDANNKQTQEIIRRIEEQKVTFKQKKEEIIEIKQKKKEIEKIGPSARCPTCDRILEKQYSNLLKKYDEEIVKKNHLIDSIQSSILKLEKEHEKISREQQALNKKQSYLQNVEIKKEKLTTSLENTFDEINKETKELQQKKHQISDIRTIAFNEQKYLTIKNKVKEVYANYQSSLDAFAKIRSKLETQKIQKERSDGQQKIVTQDIKNLQQKIVEQIHLEKRLDSEKKDAQYLKITYEIMISFRTFLISQIRPMLSQYASELFEQLTDGKYLTIELDEDYNILIYDNNTAYKIERFSGGEEDLANLCIRLAVSEVITERAGSAFHFIILDEIFGSQDSNRRQNIIRALHSLSSKFRQIFLITHIEEIKNFTENIIAVTEDENGISIMKTE